MIVGHGSLFNLKNLFILLFAIDLFNQLTMANDQRFAVANDGCSSVGECELVCWRIENIGAITDRMFAQTCKVELGHFLYLTIENVTFANRKISGKWFEGRYAIYSLTFRHCKFTMIERNAFTENAFQLLKLLTFENVPHFSLENGQFSGINEMCELTFRNTTLDRIDERFLPQIAKYLYKFEMISLPRSTITIDDLLEHTKLPVLWTFHLECAHITNELLTERNLAALTIVHTLKLIDCKIGAITVTAFNRISKTLKILNLQRNRLMTLDENIFDKLILHRVAEIVLTDNPWLCDANVIALAEKLHNHNLPFDITQCASAPSSLPTSTSSSENGSTSTLLPPIVNCINLIQKMKEFSIKYDSQIKHIVIKVFPRHQSHSFRLYVISFSHAIGIEEVKTCRKSKTQKCLEILTAPNTVIKLPWKPMNVNSVYTICLLEKLKQRTHPLHCISLAQTKNQKETWIPMSAKSWLLPTVIVFYSLTFVLGLSIAFALFKMRPTLLRGCRRVVVVHDKKCRRSTVVVMPKEWNSNRCSHRTTFNENDYVRQRLTSFPPLRQRYVSAASVNIENDDDYENIYETIDPIGDNMPKPIYTILK